MKFLKKNSSQKEHKMKKIQEYDIDTNILTVLEYGKDNKSILKKILILDLDLSKLDTRNKLILKHRNDIEFIDLKHISNDRYIARTIRFNDDV